MENLLITVSLKEKEKILAIQKRLFEYGIVWSSSRKALVQPIKVFNGDPEIIFIVKDGFLSWSNKKHGYSFQYETFKKVSAEEFLEG